MTTYLKIALLLCPLACSAQTVITSRQTGTIRNELTMNVAGTMDGRPFRHMLRYDVAGLGQLQRDSLLARGHRALALLVPGIEPLTMPSDPKNDRAETTTVTLQCETCTGKGELFLYGQNSLSTRKVNANRPGSMRFPLTVPLTPGDYRLVYKQRGRQPIELPLTLAEGEKKQISLP